MSLLNKYPFVSQNESEDCGLACLTMVFRKIVGYINYNDIEKICDFNHSGVSLKGLLNASRKLGFRSNAFYARKNYLEGSIEYPLIALINSNHYVVIYKKFNHKNKEYILIADPAYGLQKMAVTEFLSKWLDDSQRGILISCEKTSNCKSNISSRESLYKRTKFFLRFFKKKWNMLLYIFFSLLMISTIQLLLPYLTQNLVDRGINKKDINYVWLILIAQLVLIISKSVMDITRNQITLYLSSKFSLELISNYIHKLFDLPMIFFERRKIGDLIQRMDDNSRLVSFIAKDSVTISISIFSFIIASFVLCSYNMYLFLIYISCMLIYCFWSSLFLKFRKKLDYEYFSQRSDQTSSMYQLFEGIEEIKLQGCNARIQQEFENIYSEGLIIEIKRLTLLQVNRIGAVLINQGRYILISIIASLFVIDNKLSLGALLAIQFVIGQLESPVDEIVNFIYKWQDVSIGIDRMNLVYKEENEVQPSHQMPPYLTPENILIKNLSFKYNVYDKNMVLENLSFIIPRNKVTAIVGTSGSGKTTLLKLLLGYYQPNEGSIFIGGQNLRNINLVEWRKQCGVVMQDGYIFSDTIQNNIMVSDYTIPNECNMKQAADLALISDTIEATPLKYKTKIGNEGTGLSKGQMQRILIARVIFKNPNYIFLDEATNSLDTKSERVITKNLEKFYQNKTVMIIAHRMSTVRKADQILVLDNGKIIEKGNHKDLIAQKGKYYELVKEQLELDN